MECSFLALFVPFLFGLVQVTNTSERSNLHKRATGATEYDKGEYPFHASFWFMGGGNHVAERSDGRRHVYGGVLIHPYWVLTPYKIFFQSNRFIIEAPINIREWNVVLGMHAQKDAYDEAEFHHIDEIRTSNTIEDNSEKLALVKLKKPVKTIRPAKYSESGCPTYNDDLTVLGWGPNICHRGFAQSSDVPHKMTNKVSKNWYTKSNRLFCGIDYQDQHGSRFTDIGSPVLATCDDKEEVVGLVWRGFACSSYYYSDIYLNISAQAEWIKETING